MKRLGGGLANQMRALGYRVTPPSDPSDGACWEVHPPHSNDTILLAKDEAEGWKKAEIHWYEQNIAKIVLKQETPMTNQTPAVDAAVEAVPPQEPVAWVFELARAKSAEGWCDWGPPRLSFTEPCVPEGSIRNLRPLYAAMPLTIDREALARVIYDASAIPSLSVSWEQMPYTGAFYKIADAIVAHLVGL